MRRAAIIFTTVMLASAAGCGATSGPVATPTTSAPTQVTTAPTPPPEILAFDSPHTFPDGSTVTVSAQRYIGRYPESAGRYYHGGPIVHFTVTVKNGSPSAVIVNSAAPIEVTSGGQPLTTPLTTGYDTTLHDDGGNLLPGQTQTYDVLYEVSDIGAELVTLAQTPRVAGAPADRKITPGDQVYYRGVVKP